MATAQHLTCPACHGNGHTKETEPEMELRWQRELGGYVEVKTLKQGSGCPKCFGRGVLHDSR